MNAKRDKPEQDADIARLLRELGPRETPPDELKRHWEARFRAELVSARRSRRKRRLLPLAALAASIVAVVLLLNPAGDPVPDTQSMTVVALTGDAHILAADATRQQASPGRSLTRGDVLVTAANSRVGLDWAGFDIRLNENTRVRLDAQEIELEGGELYISSRGRTTAFPVATIVTPLATVRDIGTQFKVRYDGRFVETSVREGAIEVQTATGDQQARALPGESRSLLVGPDGAVESAADDSDWSWITSVARPLNLEGLSVLEFLQWAASETGYELKFVDSAAELSAGYTRFSGDLDLEGLDPQEAMALVLSTTRFEAAREDGALLITRRKSE